MIISILASILTGWFAQKATHQQKRKEAADRRREDHDDAWKKYLETGNVEYLGPHHVVSSGDPFKGHYSLRGDIADWKAWEAPIPEDANLGTLQASHRELAEAWKDSSAYNTCCNLFQNHVLKQETLKITSAMCLGLGSLSEYLGAEYEACRENPMSQLVVFENWLQLLSSKHSIGHIYFQDPSFNALDVEFLKSRGCTVLHTPECEDFMTTETFLFTPGVTRFLALAPLQVAYPALYHGVPLTEHLLFSTPPGTTSDDQAWPMKIGHTHLPLEEPHERRLLRLLLSQVVALPLPTAERFEWLDYSPLYYKADPDIELEPIKDFNMRITSATLSSKQQRFGSHGAYIHGGCIKEVS